ncbi:MAG TPA: methyltransferase domain-containing protein [Jatrophihabitans sp.]|nr:methyltransferase domain-containing protein [Jatrophihabitans sp.]
MTAAAPAGTTELTAYALDPSWHAERERLSSLTALYDEPTMKICERVGLGPGWHCAEVGAGTGSVAAGLAERVGRFGHVVAVDLDVRFLEPLRSEHLEVRRMDITAESLPDGEFDLVHARLLLEHLPQRDAVLRALVRTLAPGGWLVIEDFDWSTATIADPPSPALERVTAACRAAFALHGYDPEYGRRLPRALRSAGLADVRTSTSAAQVWADPESGIPQWELLVAQLAPALTAHQLISQSDLDEFTRLCHDGETALFAPLMVSCAGRKPRAGVERRPR